MSEEYQQQQQQLQWVTSAAGGAAGDGCGGVGGFQDGQYGAYDDMQQQMVMQLHAGGQRMVLDLDELVAGADRMHDMQQAGPWSAVAA
jgi:hypothetical protein